MPRRCLRHSASGSEDGAGKTQGTRRCDDKRPDEALAPRARASRYMRCRAWLRLSVSSLVYPATSPSASVHSWASMLLKDLRARTSSPNTSPWIWVIR